MDATCRPCLAGLLTLVLGLPSLGQTSPPDTLDALGGATHVIVPQARGFNLTPNRAVPLDGGVEIESVTALVEIRDLVAATTLQITMPFMPNKLQVGSHDWLSVPIVGIKSAYYNPNAAESISQLSERVLQDAIYLS